MFRYCSAFQGEGRVTVRQLEQGGGGLRATGCLNTSLEGVGTLGGLRSVWASCFKSFCAICSLRGGPQESPPPQGPTADWRRHSRPKPRQPDSLCRTSGMADTGLLVSHYWPQIQDSMQLWAGMIIFTMCSGRQEKLECRERQLKQCNGEKSRDEKPGSPWKKRGGGVHSQGPLRPLFWPPWGPAALPALAHVQPTLHFSSGKLELYLLRETQGALAKQVGWHRSRGQGRHSGCTGRVHMGMSLWGWGGPITLVCQNQTCIQVIFADDKTE